MYESLLLSLFLAIQGEVPPTRAAETLPPEFAPSIWG